LVVFLNGSRLKNLGYSLLHVMNITIAVLNVIEITLLCQLQLMPPAVVYRYSPDYAETQALQVLSMSCQENDPQTPIAPSPSTLNQTSLSL
jgi:hypothetical protein